MCVASLFHYCFEHVIIHNHVPAEHAQLLHVFKNVRLCQSHQKRRF
jgi:hypothetical protein